MKQTNANINRNFKFLMLSSAVTICISGTAFAQSISKVPALTITNQPLPASLSKQVYTKPIQTENITSQSLLQQDNIASDTIIARKIADVTNELNNLQNKLSSFSSKLSELEQTNRLRAADYYASLGTISTQLQSGTTPGNPRLLQKLAFAQESLDSLTANVNDLNNLAIEITNSGSVASYLLESTRSAYGLTGAIEEDHVNLAKLEDGINNTVILIDRLQNNINDDITRTSAYLTAERNNLRTMALAIADGNLMGKALSTRPFTSSAKPTTTVEMAESAKPELPPSISNPRPLVKIRFDKASVNYEQPVYMALNEAMDKYPSARFELVAVYPAQGNAAQVAIESTKSKRNAEKVMRSMSQMGLDMEKVDISYAASNDVTDNEVHIYVR